MSIMASYFGRKYAERIVRVVPSDPPGTWGVEFRCPEAQALEFVWGMDSKGDAEMVAQRLQRIVACAIHLAIDEHEECFKKLLRDEVKPWDVDGLPPIQGNSS